jgi:hypothetical protein
MADWVEDPAHLAKRVLAGGEAFIAGADRRDVVDAREVPPEVAAIRVKRADIRHARVTGRSEGSTLYTEVVLADLSVGNRADSAEDREHR